MTTKHRTQLFKGISRADLEAGASRVNLETEEQGGLLMTDAELSASLDVTLKDWNESEAVYVFAYGSLIWNPCMEHSGRISAYVRGYHRRFCLWSHEYRGTPDNPGLVLALESGGSATGVLYRLSPELVRSELTLLWRREMIGGAYTAHWVKAHTEDGALPAIAFVVNHASGAYAGRLSDAAVVEKLATCSGRYGSGADYLCQTAAALRATGAEDKHLDTLCDMLSARQM